MIELLLDIKERGEGLKPKSNLSFKTKEAFTRRYDAIINEGYLANPPPEQKKRPAKTGAG